MSSEIVVSLPLNAETQNSGQLKGPESRLDLVYTGLNICKLNLEYRPIGLYSLFFRYEDNHMSV